MSNTVQIPSEFLFLRRVRESECERNEFPRIGCQLCRTFIPRALPETNREGASTMCNARQGREPDLSVSTLLVPVEPLPHQPAPSTTDKTSFGLGSTTPRNLLDQPAA
jgi:hypothetical protein